MHSSQVELPCFTDLPTPEHNFANYESTTAVPSLVSSAHGTVLDLGPGTGNQLDRFDAARVDHVYGVEPNTAFAERFVERLRETPLGQDGKYTLVPCGIEDHEMLGRFGIVEESVDCIVSMQVMVKTIYLLPYRLSCWAFRSGVTDVDNRTVFPTGSRRANSIHV